MIQVKEFIENNFRSLIIITSFIVTMYVQHVNNTSRIVELSNRCITLEVKIEDQYDKIDAIKLDKVVYETTMQQFTSMQTDLREMRSDIKELLKNKG
ncbi:hypothetical protein [Parabacteroides goldsteinii]|jgi:hypothetical protein|uniref:hypothetical protein n=1 Tax=Parabacteroides goldsteinii TaxID=328812 RepID=UPI001D1F7315|nr:hypothetical protein [Parabacteroides goldsteinii]MBS6574780.1 hypothetical protein [Parabacteroides goldsteinii]